VKIHAPASAGAHQGHNNMTLPNTGTHPALQALDAIGRHMPGVWARYEHLRAAYRAKVDWPQWCFAPMAVAFPITGEHPALAAKLTALAAWRMTKGIYRVDPTLLPALINTPLDAAVPVDILRRLPEWCIYLELDQLPTFRGPARGVWVSMELAGTADPGPVFLSLLVDTAHASADAMDEKAMLPLNIKLSGDSLLESLRQTYKAAPELHEMIAAVAEPIVSVLIYLCSQGVDLTRNGSKAWPSKPSIVRTRRHGERLFPAPAPVTWELGVRMGAALRAAYAAADASHGDGTGRTVVPHLRRAHFHTILSGPMKGVLAAQRQREVRWMPPVAVNLRDPEQLVATIRPVR